MCEKYNVISFLCELVEIFFDQSFLNPKTFS